MKVISIIIVVFLWMAVWGIFDIFTEDKTNDEKIKIYIVILGIIICIICFFPDILYHI